MGNFCWGWCCGGGGKLYVIDNGWDIHQVSKDLATVVSSASLPASATGHIDFDAAGNVIVANGQYLLSYTPSLGGVNWSQLYTDFTQFNDIAIDLSNGWIYAACHPGTGGAPNIKGVRKFNLSDGSEIATGGWPYDLGTQSSGFPSAIAWSVAIDSNGDVWVGHYTKSSAGNPTLTKLSSAGSFIADYQPFSVSSGTGPQYEHPAALAIDSSNNVYCALSRLGTLFTNHLVKLNSSGVKQWGATPDASGNLGDDVFLFDNETKVVVSCNVNGSPNNTVYAYNSAGSLLWGDNTNRDMNGICRDEDDNLYVAIQDTVGTYTVVSYDKDGNELDRLSQSAVSGWGFDVGYFPG